MKAKSEIKPTVTGSGLDMRVQRRGPRGVRFLAHLPLDNLVDSDDITELWDAGEGSYFKVC